MATPPPRGPALRVALLDEAVRLLETEGYAAFNTRALAARLGVTQPAFYRHFPSREALFEEIILRGLKGLAAAASGVAEADDPYTRLQRYGTVYVRYAAENPAWFRLTFGRRGALAAVADRLGEADASHAGALHALAQVVPADHPTFGPSYRAWWALAHGLAFLTIEGVFSLVDTDEERICAAEAAIAAHVEGLRARWGPPGPPVPLTTEELFARLVPDAGVRAATR